MRSLIFVIWLCDKSDCGQVNRRWLKPGAKIFDDTCEHCGLHIHEPIVEPVEEKQTTKSDEEDS